MQNNSNGFIAALSAISLALLAGCVVDELSKPGVETGLAHPPEYWTGASEGTRWALLALGVWCEGAGIE